MRQYALVALRVLEAIVLILMVATFITAFREGVRFGVFGLIMFGIPLGLCELAIEKLQKTSRA